MKELEIIILDSMSEDNSSEIARRYNCTVIGISQGTFNHGLTRNIGVQYAAHELIYFTVQDAFMAEDTMLEKMLVHFNNPEVMGVVGHQAVPHEKDKNPLQWFRRYTEPKATYRKLQNGTKISSLPHAAQKKIIAWDNVVAMYRKTALVAQPFSETQFAEDWIWSRYAIERGWTLVHEPSAVAYHYHHQGYRFAYKVAWAVNFHFFVFFGYLPDIPNLADRILKTGYHLAKSTDLSNSEKMKWCGYNFLTDLGTFNSHLNFKLTHFFGGEEALEKRYRKVCKEVPQGRQNENV